MVRGSQGSLGIEVAAQAHTPVEDLEREIDAILEGRPPVEGKVVRRKLALTEENVRRLFGMSRWELLRALAGALGYVIEDEAPPTTK